jgi:hypothetical protein
MTIPVGDHGLTCLDGNDYSAVALWMQESAETIDDTLAETNAALSNYRNRPWFEAVNISTITVSNGSGFTLPEGKSGEVATSSGSWATTSNNLNIGTSAPKIPAGLYYAGSSVTWTVATPNNNTIRTLELFGVQTINGTVSISTTYDQIFQNQIYEASVGINSLNVSGFINSDGTMGNIVAAFWHLNTSSDLVVAAGNWRFWVMYMGSGLVV